MKSVLSLLIFIAVIPHSAFAQEARPYIGHLSADEQNCYFRYLKSSYEELNLAGAFIFDAHDDDDWQSGKDMSAMIRYDKNLKPWKSMKGYNNGDKQDPIQHALFEIMQTSLHSFCEERESTIVLWTLKQVENQMMNYDLPKYFSEHPVDAANAGWTLVTTAN